MHELELEQPVTAEFVAGMNRYAMYGGVLESALPFPELASPADGVEASHVWRLRICREPVSALTDSELIGERAIGAEAYVLRRHGERLRLEYSHAGVFDIDTVDGSVTWYPGAKDNAELARAIVIGPIAALLLESRGDLCLHGSAVLAGDGAIGFVAPKHHGKSTLALAMTAAGCRLMSDDLVAITADSPPLMRPAVPTMRLWGDAVDELQPERLCDARVDGVKQTLGRFHDDRVATAPAPLRAIYALVPAPAADARARRVRMAGAEAAIALAQQKKLADSLIGYVNAASRLPRAAALAAAVPVYELHVPRDFRALPGVVERLLEWHGGSVTAPVDMDVR